MSNKGSIIIATFGGLGKTTFARRHPSLAIDLEAIPYKYLYRSKRSHRLLNEGSHEALKGLDHDRSLNPAFPMNYVQAIVDNLGTYRYILIVLSPEVLKELERRGIGYYLLLPSSDSSEVILERMRRRGNSPEFVHKMRHLLSREEIEAVKKTLRPIACYYLPKNGHVEAFIASTFDTRAAPFRKTPPAT